MEEDRGIPDDAVVGIRFAATPYRHSFCSRTEEKPERQFWLRDELTKIGVPRSYLKVLDWELSRPRNEDGEIDFVNVATLEVLFKRPIDPQVG